MRELIDNKKRLSASCRSTMQSASGSAVSDNAETDIRESGSLRSWLGKQLRRLAAIAAIMSCGCNLPSITPQPVTPAEPQKVEVVVRVEDGKLTVNDATINVKATGSASAEKCDCGCNQEDCRCSARSLTRAGADTTARSGPQIVTQKVYQCRNGVCGWYDVPIVASQPQQMKRAASSGLIRVYLQPNYLATNNASRAMRLAIGERDDIEWLYGQPPAVNGRATWPTAQKPDGSAWSSGDWTDGSAEAFRAWAGP